MYRVKCFFSCNAGNTEENVIVEIHDREQEEKEIHSAFHTWLDNNEDVQYEKLYEVRSCPDCPNDDMDVINGCYICPECGYSISI